MAYQVSVVRVVLKVEYMCLACWVGLVDPVAELALLVGMVVV
jgi:hypothetical protein